MNLVGEGGIEPPASVLSGLRSPTELLTRRNLRYLKYSLMTSTPPHLLTCVFIKYSMQYLLTGYRKPLKNSVIARSPSDEAIPQIPEIASLRSQ